MIFNRHVVLAIYYVAAMVGAVGVPFAEPVRSQTAQVSEGQRAVRALVDQAQKEQRLKVSFVSSVAPVRHKLTEAFKKWLKDLGADIDVSLTPESDTENYAKAVAETQAKVRPTYDAIEGPERDNISLMNVGGTQKIENLELLLRELHPRVRAGEVSFKDISPYPFTGYGVVWGYRHKGLLYNPKLISRDQLPRTHADLTAAKYKGMWAQPPWTSHWDIALVALQEVRTDNWQEWVEVVRKASKNAAAVLAEKAAVERMIIGEWAFVPGNAYYYFQFKDKDPKAPIELTFFRDYNVQSPTLYVLRQGARSPAAATLFLIWMSTPQAQSIWQPVVYTENLLGTSEIDKKVQSAVSEAGARIVSWIQDKKAIELLNWLGSEQGRNYTAAIGKAIRGR